MDNTDATVGDGLPQDHWTCRALTKSAKALIKAGNDLSFAAQTSGGTAGRDAALAAAWPAARAAEEKIQFDRLIYWLTEADPVPLEMPERVECAA